MFQLRGRDWLLSREMLQKLKRDKGRWEVPEREGETSTDATQSPDCNSRYR